MKIKNISRFFLILSLTFTASEVSASATAASSPIVGRDVPPSEFVNPDTAAEALSFLGLDRVAVVYPATVSGYQHLPSVGTLTQLRRIETSLWDSEARSADEFRFVRSYYLDATQRYLRGLNFATVVGEQRESLLAMQERMLREVDEATRAPLESIDAAAVWLTAGFRALRLATEGLPPSDDEAKVRNIFEPIPGSRRIFALDMPTASFLASSASAGSTPAWQHSTMAVLQAAGKSKTPGLDEDDRFGGVWVSKGVKHLVKQRLSTLGARSHTIVHDSTLLPLPGQGKFGLTLGLAALLEGHAFLSMPYRTLSAHRLGMTPIWTTAHDKAHGTLQDPTEALEIAARTLAHKLSIEMPEASFKVLTPLATDLVATRFLQLQGASRLALRIAIDEFLADMVAAGTDTVLQGTAKQRYNSRLATLFEVYHENGGVGAEELQQSGTLQESYHRMVLSAFEKPMDVEVLNPLATDPVTGRSALPSEEIVRVMREQTFLHIDAYPLPQLPDYSSPPTIAGYAAFYEDTPPIVEGVVPATEEPRSIIQAGPLLWQIRQVLRNGTALQASVASLAVKIHDRMDQNDLLNIAGRAVPVPDFTSIDEPAARQEVGIAFIRAVAGAQRTMAEDFLTWFDERVLPRVSGTVGAEYRSRFDSGDALLDGNQERIIAAIMTNLVQGAEEAADAFERRQARVNRLLRTGKADEVVAPVPPVAAAPVDVVPVDAAAARASSPVHGTGDAAEE